MANREVNSRPDEQTGSANREFSSAFDNVGAQAAAANHRGIIVTSESGQFRASLFPRRRFGSGRVSYRVGGVRAGTVLPIRESEFPCLSVKGVTQRLQFVGEPRTGRPVGQAEAPLSLRK